MKGMLIPTNGNPVEIDIEVDETGSTLHDLQRLVGGNIEPFDVIFGEGISLYVNEEGLFTCPPNRAVYATKGIEEAGYLSMMDYSSPVKEGDWPRDATPAHRHEKTPPSCRYIEDPHGRKVGKHHGIRQEHPRCTATTAPRPR